MKLKKLSTLALVSVLFVAVFCMCFVGGTAHAASSGSIFKSSTANNSSMASNTEKGGIDIVIKTTSDSGYVTSYNNIDLNKYAIEFYPYKANFKKLYFKFVNTEDSDVGFVVTLESVVEGETTSLVLRVFDTLDFVDADVSAKVTKTISAFDFTQNYFWLEYAAGTLSYKTKPVNDDGTAAYTALAVLAQNGKGEGEADFSWVEETIYGWRPLKESTLEVGVLGQQKVGDDLGKDANGKDIEAKESRINVLSVTNWYGTQQAGDKLTVRPVIKSSLKDYRGYVIDEGIDGLDLAALFNAANFKFETEGDDTPDIDCKNIVLAAAQGQKYTFPFYTVGLEKEQNESESKDDKVYFNSSFSSIAYYTKENGGEWKKGTDTITGTTDAYTLSKDAGTAYAFVFKAKTGRDAAAEKDTFFEFAVTVNSVEDTVAPTVDKAKFLEWAMTEYPEIFGQTQLNAPDSGSYIFPAITRSANARYGIVSDKIGVKDEDETTWYDNDFNQLSVVVGYKKDNATTDYVYGTSTSVSIKEVGEWTFAYMVKDQSGNKTVIYAFTMNVNDVTAPTIRISTPTKELQIDKVLEVPTATRSDNCSGIDTSLNKYTVYYLDYSLGEKGYATDADGNIKFEDLKTLSSTAITNGFKLTKEYQYKDENGNVKPAFIVVYEATDKAGNHTVAKDYGYIKVIDKSETEKEKNPVNETLEIVLIVVVALLIVGVLVLLFVNPAQKKHDARLAAQESIANDNGGDKDTDKTEKTDEQDK